MSLNQLANLIGKPFQVAIKKLMFQLLEERYGKHEDVIERVSNSVVTEKDYEAFAKMIVDVYEKAYISAIKQHKEILEAHGLKANIVMPKPEEKEGPSIFKNQSEKSG